MKTGITRQAITLLLLALLLAVAAGCTSAEQAGSSARPAGPKVTVTDAVGRTVEVPEKVDRIACLYAFSGHVVAMLGRGDSIVAVVQGLKRDMLLNTLVPAIQNAVVPYAVDKVNVEELLKAQPDLIFVQLTAYQDEREREKLDKLKVPYFVVDFNSMASQITIIEMMGKAIGRSEEAKKYTDYYRASVARVSKAVEAVPPEKRVRIFHSILEATRTDASDTLPADWTKAAGLVNVSVGEPLRFADDKYFASLEQVYVWDPDAVLVNEDSAFEYITTNASWAALRAVKSQKVYKMPNGISRWGHQGSVETPLGVLWTAKTLYPDLFRDLDMRQETKDAYKSFFHLQLSDDDVTRVLAGMGMRDPRKS